MIGKLLPTGNLYYCIASGVIVQADGDDEVTVLDTVRGHYWRGNASAILVLDQLRRPVSLERIVEVLQLRYDVERERVVADTEALLRSLCATKLVRKVRS